MIEIEQPEEPVFAIEFWDEQGELVIVHFNAEGETDSHVAQGTNSDALLKLKGKPVAQVSVLHDEETGAYRRIGELYISQDVPSIDALIIELMSMPVTTYDKLTSMLESAIQTPEPKRVLH